MTLILVDFNDWSNRLTRCTQKNVNASTVREKPPVLTEIQEYRILWTEEMFRINASQLPGQTKTSYEEG